jgi:hypothetical protein
MYSSSSEDLPVQQLLKRALQKERTSLMKRVTEIDRFIEAYNETPAAAIHRGKRRGRHKLSAAAKRKISAAQKARWAKLKKGKEG